jgi:hypothetical protein
MPALIHYSNLIDYPVMRSSASDGVNNRSISTHVR